MIARRLLQAFKVVDKRVNRREIDFINDFQRDRAVHMGFELGAVFLGVFQFHAHQLKQEIQMPPSAAEFAVGNIRQADRFFFGHQLRHFGIFYFVQLFHRAFAAHTLTAGLFDGIGAQKAADDVKTIRRTVAQSSLGEQFAHVDSLC